MNKSLFTNMIESAIKLIFLHAKALIHQTEENRIRAETAQKTQFATQLTNLIIYLQ